MLDRSAITFSRNNDGSPVRKSISEIPVGKLFILVTLPKHAPICIVTNKAYEGRIIVTILSGPAKGELRFLRPNEKVEPYEGQLTV